MSDSMEETGGTQYRTHAANKLHEKKLNQAFFIKSNEHTNDQEFLVGVKKELMGPNQTAKHQ